MLYWEEIILAEHLTYYIRHTMKSKVKSLTKLWVFSVVVV